MPLRREAEIRAALRAILGSKAFGNSVGQSKLLEYVCSKTLACEASAIKEYTLAIEVFGRSEELVENGDAFVRVEAHRLRKRLAKYYETEGAGQLVRIVIPPGGYVPEFVFADEMGPEPVPSVPSTPRLSDPPPAPVGQPAAAPESPAARLPQAWLRPLLWGAGLLAFAALLLVALRSTQNVIAVVPPGSPASHPPSSAGTVRLRAGALRDVYVDKFGRTWEPDTWFQGGTTDKGPSFFLGHPPDAGLFRSVREGTFSYDIPLKPGVYELRLFFADPHFRNLIDVGHSGENQRRFNVTANGQLLLRNFDPIMDAGFAPVDVRAFKDISPASDGALHLKFWDIIGGGLLNALELLPGLPGKIHPIRVRMHELSYTDEAGNYWSADNYFVGGRLATHTRPVQAGNAELYAGQRYGNFSYAIPVPPGSYTVVLHFVEASWGPNAPNGGGLGSRVFDVTCNGVALLQQFDIFKAGGKAYAPVARTFRGLRPNGQGKLLLSFSPRRDYATVNAIEVVDEAN